MKLRGSEVCVPLLVCVSLALADWSPQNLCVLTLNTQYVLHWDWPDDQQSATNGTLTFTAQYLSAVYSRKPPHRQQWRNVCVEVLERRCDFTGAGLSYWGMYLLRVRASTAQQFSNWTSISFCPDKEAVLGPPSSVKLTSAKGVLEIAIADPVSCTNESMKALVDSMYYLIQYWKRPEGYQKAEVLKTQNNVVTLAELDQRAEYCVRVQSRYEFYNKTSEFSDTHCTHTQGLTTHWQIFLYFLLSLGLCFLLALLAWFSFYKVFKAFKSIFYPNVQLPPHIQELWLSDSETPHLLPPLRSGSVWDQLDLISAETVPDIQISIPADQDTSVPSQHGSRDSGFSSTEDDSGVRTLSSTRTDTHTHTDHRCRTDTQYREEVHDGMLEICA